MNIEQEIPIGNPNPCRNCYYDPVTAAVVVTGIAAGAGAVEARKSRKQAKSQAESAEAAARKVTEEKAALAAEEKTAADKKLAEARARLLKKREGRTDLLFGSEKGVEQEDSTQSTLGV
jgi:hypothetical protein